MNIKTILICLSLLLPHGVLAHQIAVPRLTVKMLIAHYSGKIGKPFHEQSADAIIKAQLVDGYLAGVADSTEGKIWCDKGKVKTDEINSMVVAELRKLSPKDQDKSAAQAAIEILGAKLPCQ